ncbi:MAG: bifunctional 2-polyprenyl-6-hydroxyphenol methylase/3-demethylubiquinol 3-O-methyltransferase UbiG [Gammaproteobacteria bacterium]|nr:MAG: bifunctional 2-polyprenyl-6-hydroxyphenol methylase/3-demethylubiquinol 3-O-methyltransferase UbiG [Gammaproteobacteria bacterium]|tara:strand:+ start:2996 stop:3706 length:711 start_codon:yes stop_codon:yes gene_type:complete
MNIKNLDHEEVNKFDELAAKWWDMEGEFKPLHQINPLRVGFIKDRSILEGKKILDVGCGGGILAEALSELGANVTGIDASENTIGVAKSHSKSINSNVRFIQNTIEEFIASNPDEKFDVITCLEMLEHVPSPGEIIKNCSDILKKDGDIFFSTINRNPRSYLFAVIGAEYILNLLPKGTHDYEKFIKPSELAKWIREAGLNSEETIGLSYNPITDNYWLGKDIQVNYMVHAKKGKD